MRRLAAWALGHFVLLLLALAHASSVLVAEFDAVPDRGEQQSPASILSYYLSDEGPSRPRLVVRLTVRAADGAAVAEVFDTPRGERHVPLEVDGDRATLPSALPVRIRMEAPGGWWTSGVRVNHDFDAYVYGRVHAMWGAERWLDVVADDELTVRLSVRSEGDGDLPSWDLRQLVPTVGGGRYRVNYAEAKCRTERPREPSVSPQWPFVAAAGSFEQRPGSSRPPVVVDWDEGRVTAFSEVVPVRTQNCSYSLYSIASLEGARVTQANFETPFAFYDLTGRGEGYPNMILRTEYFPASDRYSTGVAPEVQRGAAVRRPIEWIRYSWRNQVGDARWDYKVEVLGNHAFTDRTEIAGGEYAISAPSYADYPDWILSREWPVVTFVDTEGASYRSSEGIYDWSPRGVGGEYFLAGAERPSYSAYSDIRRGFRGEVRATRDAPVELYLSPIDNRLHLFGAEHGFWNLGDGTNVRVKDVSRDGYIDSWTLERQRAPNAEEVGSDASGTARHSNGTTDITRIVTFGPYLLTAHSDGVIVDRVDLPKSVIEVVPPTDEASWARHVAALEPFEAQRRDPQHFADWRDAHEASASYAYDGARLEDVAIQNDILYAALHVAGVDSGRETTPSPAVSDVPNGNLLPPGRYVMTLGGDAPPTVQRISEAPFADITASVSAMVDAELVPGRLTVRFANASEAPAWGPADIRIGDEVVWSEAPVLVPAQGTLERTVTWLPRAAGVHDLNVVLGDETIATMAVEVAPAERPLGWQAASLGFARHGNEWWPPLILAFFAALVLVGAKATWRRSR